MLTPDMIARINELAKKQREGTLTDEERAEQSRLRRTYIDHIKGQVKLHMDAVQNHAHDENCSCGCKEKH
jgi:uncharacterized protein YnzC (UPF0291/DUF896 family)